MEDDLKYAEMFYDKYLVTLDKKYLEEARYYYEKVKEHPIAKMRLYVVYKLLGEEAKAQQIYESLSNSQQKYVDALFIYPTNPDKALVLLEGDADFPEFYLLKASILMYFNRYKETLEVLERAKDHFPPEYITPILNTFKRFLEATDLTMQEIILRPDGQIIEITEYNVKDGESMLRQIWAGKDSRGYIIRLPKDKELRELAIQMLYHSYVPVPKDLLLKLKWNG